MQDGFTGCKTGPAAAPVSIDLAGVDADEAAQTVGDLIDLSGRDPSERDGDPVQPARAALAGD